MDDHHERVGDLLARWVEMHAGLRKLLQLLPLPIGISDLKPDETREALTSVAKAAQIVFDQPVTEQAQDLIAQALTFWLAAYDLITVFHHKGDPWRENAASLTIQQSAALAIMATQELDR